MMSKAKYGISVVIPLYNKAAYVERAIQSVLSQGESIKEVIVVDDGSTDDGAERAKAIGDARVRVVRKANGGPSSARNRGIEEAKSDFVGFLDADDIYLPGFIDEVLKLIGMYPHAAIYATSYVLAWPDGRTEEAKPPRGIKPDSPQIVEDFYCVFSRSSFFSISSSACVKKQILVEQGILFPLGENVGEDQDVIFRLAENFDIAFSPKCLAQYTKGVADSLYSRLPDKLPPNSERLAQRLKAGLIPPRHRKGARRLLSVYCLNIARINLKRGQRKQGLGLLFRREAWFHVVYWLRTAARFAMPDIFFRSRWTRRI